MPVHTLIAIALSMVAGVASAGQEFAVTTISVGGEGGHDYITAEPGTGRVFVSRGTHVMVVDGATGRLIGDIPDTPRVHGIALAKKWNHGFITNGGDSTVTMFDLKSLATLKRIPVSQGGLDGITYEGSTDRVVLTNHSKPGTVTAIDAKSGEITGTAELEDAAPEGAVSDGRGRLFVNGQMTSAIHVVDMKSMKVTASWPLAPCKAPTGIAYDGRTRRLFVGCSNTSVVVDAGSGKVVATIANGDGVDAMGWDPARKLLYIPAGRSGNVTVVHQDSADHYTVVATVATLSGARTISVDPTTHKAYQLALEYGPVPPDAPAPAPGGPAVRGPIIGARLIVISHAGARASGGS